VLDDLLAAERCVTGRDVPPQMYSTYTVFVWRYCTFVTDDLLAAEWCVSVMNHSHSSLEDPRGIYMAYLAGRNVYRPIYGTPPVRISQGEGLTGGHRHCMEFTVRLYGYFCQEGIGRQCGAVQRARGGDIDTRGW
jgi:hypothetical protein